MLLHVPVELPALPCSSISSKSRHRGNLFTWAALHATTGQQSVIRNSSSSCVQVLRLPETAFGWLFIPLVGGMVLGSAASSRMAHQVPPSTIVRCGFALAAVAIVINLAYTYTSVPAVPWAVAPIMLYTFGAAMALPTMTMITLGTFPNMKGLAASLQSFFQMLIFAIVSSVVAPTLFSSAFKMAEGLTVGLVLSVMFWMLGNLRRKEAM